MTDTSTIQSSADVNDEDGTFSLDFLTYCGWVLYFEHVIAEGEDGHVIDVRLVHKTEMGVPVRCYLRGTSRVHGFANANQKAWQILWSRHSRILTLPLLNNMIGALTTTTTTHLTVSI